MFYRKILVSFENNPTRFYREMWVRTNLTLQELGVCICTALGATFEHYFMFEDSKRSYIPLDFEDTFGNQVFMSDYHIYDIIPNKNNEFTLIYDTGEYYSFKIKLLESGYSNCRKKAYIINGAGDRIWEDNISSLLQYLNGEINDDNCLEENMPWNVEEGYKLSDFDLPYDVESADYYLCEDANKTLRYMKKIGIKY